jgi:outer membrane protein OmpA-like peptidoglycan-associated protein
LVAALGSFAGAPAASAQSMGGSISLPRQDVFATTSPDLNAPPSEAEANSGDSYMLRYRPTTPSFELGLYAGAMLFDDDTNLEDLDITVDTGHDDFQTGAELGLRAAFFPVSFFGLEAEGGLIFSEANDNSTQIWIFRGHGILQLPLARLVPFALVGFSMFALSSGDDALGDDIDPALHFGGGLKFALSRGVSLRADFRDTLLQKNKLLEGVEDGDMVHNFEILGGLSFTWGRTPWAPEPPDLDKDGIYDRDDRCPSQVGPKPDGCPVLPPPPDADGDGLTDALDGCPAEPEDKLQPVPNDGCPNKDIDSDGIFLPADLCPEQVGIAPDGCPPKDTDNDGIKDPDDKCIEQPESHNNFEDGDGCPDELPKEVAKFTGVIKGIMFDTGKATIRPASFPLLDDAVAVLLQYPGLRIRVSGHTDDKGKHDANVQLSLDRANSVKTYLEGKGVGANRIQTRGAGPDEPIADNKTSAGRAQNRRIEFELLPQLQASPAADASAPSGAVPGAPSPAPVPLAPSAPPPLTSEPPAPSTPAAPAP